MPLGLNGNKIKRGHFIIFFLSIHMNQEKQRISPVILALFPETLETHVLRALMAGHHPRQIHDDKIRVPDLTVKKKPGKVIIH